MIKWMAIGKKTKKKKELTNTKYFHSSLNNTKFPIDDYEYAKKFMIGLNVKTFKNTLIYM